jgi:rRNA-processing protein FCF1
MSGTDGGVAVILDSNFLFIPLRFGVDVFGELQRLFGRPITCIVPTPIIAELQLLRLDAKPSFKKEIDFALGLIDRCEVINETLGPGETVDDILLRMALETGYLVATNDADLRQRLREVGIPVIYLRQRAFLEIDGCV